MFCNGESGLIVDIFLLELFSPRLFAFAADRVLTWGLMTRGSFLVWMISTYDDVCNERVFFSHECLHSRRKICREYAIHTLESFEFSRTTRTSTAPISLVSGMLVLVSPSAALLAALTSDACQSPENSASSSGSSST